MKNSIKLMQAMGHMKKSMNDGTATACYFEHTDSFLFANTEDLAQYLDPTGHYILIGHGDNRELVKITDTVHYVRLAYLPEENDYQVEVSPAGTVSQGRMGLDGLSTEKLQDAPEGAEVYPKLLREDYSEVSIDEIARGYAVQMYNPDGSGFGMMHLSQCSDFSPSWINAAFDMLKDADQHKVFFVDRLAMMVCRKGEQLYSVSVVPVENTRMMAIQRQQLTQEEFDFLSKK